MKNLCLFVLVVLAGGACRRTDQDVGVVEPLIGCAGVWVPGLAVAVVDSASGASVPPASSVIARGGIYVDTATVTYDGVYYLLYERAGTYSLTVQHPGYRDWRRDSVTVSSDQCHVKTVNVTVRLQP